MDVINIRNLNFGYSKKTNILNDLNMTVPQGAIYGFLGSNGAGKSTTIRNILQLLKPQSGSIQLFGHSSNMNTLEHYQKIGSLIESPALYGQLSILDNMRIACKYRSMDYENIDEVLDIVGLLSHQKKSAKQLSTGMKQRLGLAVALLHDPELLILDEPTNGLDPSGIGEIRAVLKNLNAAGKTIMLSSHLLSEIEKIAGHVGILKNGSLIYEGTLDGLKELESSRTQVDIVVNNEQWVRNKYGSQVQDIGDGSLRIQLGDTSEIPKLIKTIVDAGGDIYKVEQVQSNLEQMFMSVTNEKA